LPFSAKEEAEDLLKEIKSYEDLRFWHLLYADESEIRRVFTSLRSEVTLNENLAVDAVYIVDRDLNQRGRLDDRTDEQVENNTPIYGLFDYDCTQVSELKNKMAAEDMRVLFKDYRENRKGAFDESNQRREKGLIKQ
ncbi:MAG: hypothetical protein HRU49_14495, partial [Winogradskyella sp.]|nr:hypothetical protein [Winogradskyella sp.]